MTRFATTDAMQSPRGSARAEECRRGGVRGRAGSLLLSGLFGLALPMAAASGGPALAAAADPASGPTLTRSGPVEALSRHLTDQLESHWWKRKEVLRRSGPAAAGRVGEDLIEVMTVEEIRRIPEMADALVLEGRNERKLENLTAARESFRFAHEVDPLSSAAWRHAAATRYASGDGIGTIVSLAMNGLGARWSDYWERYVSLFNLLHLLATALVVTSTLCLLVLVLREAPAVVHFVDEILPSSWPPAWREALGWLVFVAPAGLFLLGAWALLVWAVAVMMVADTRSRGLVAVCLAVLALCMPALRVTSSLAAVTADPAARVAVDVAQGAFRPGNLALLQQLERERPGEAIWKYLLARSIGLRDPDQSVALLRDAVELDPAHTEVRILLGNIYYRIGKYEKAGSVYRQALDVDKRSVLAMVNLARVRLATFDFDESEELMQRARGVSEKRVRALESGTEDDEVADPELTVTTVSRRVVAREAAAAVQGALGPVSPFSMACLASLIVGLILGRGALAGGARRCDSCGVAVCSRCTPGDAAPGICRACDHLVSRRAGLAPSARAEQARRVEAHARRRRRGRRFAHLLWPGLALVHEGRLSLGFVLAAAWCALLLALAAPSGLLPAERSVGPGIGAAVAWVLIALVWLIAQTPGFRPQAESVGRR